ncbi:MAG TPA: hypothetical protein VE759_00115 [Mycobacterium sp.]|nr:hypothetical protein [Mycobacterium sp.]
MARRTDDVVVEVAADRVSPRGRTHVAMGRFGGLVSHHVFVYARRAPAGNRKRHWLTDSQDRGLFSDHQHRFSAGRRRPVKVQ